MRLIFQGHDHRYAVEQMVTMLLPQDPVTTEASDPHQGLDRKSVV